MNNHRSITNEPMVQSVGVRVKWLSVLTRPVWRWGLSAHIRSDPTPTRFSRLFFSAFLCHQPPAHHYHHNMHHVI